MYIVTSRHALCTHNTETSNAHSTYSIYTYACLYTVHTTHPVYATHMTHTLTTWQRQKPCTYHSLHKYHTQHAHPGYITQALHIHAHTCALLGTCMWPLSDPHSCSFWVDPKARAASTALCQLWVWAATSVSVAWPLTTSDSRHSSMPGPAHHLKVSQSFSWENLLWSTWSPRD